MNAVFDPSILFISDQDWFDGSKKDFFLKYLLDNLTIINKFKISKIYWTEDLNVLLWSSPNVPPWRIDTDTRNSLVPIIYRLFPDCTIDVQNSVTEACLIQPELRCKCCKCEVDTSFMQMMHSLITRDEDVYFCVGQNNIMKDGTNYIFYCNCHATTLTPLIISNHLHWLRHIDLINEYWPKKNCTEEIEKFKQGLSIWALRTDSHDQFLYDYSFSPKFIDDIVDTNTYQEAIFSTIAKRLMLNQSDASDYAGINDEPVRNMRYSVNGVRKSVRRFRVSGENRVHYCYPDAGKILFLRYFREGQHDTGLR
ncbi:MAG: hypothetical protein H6Q69_833 [Firmicutes bacterium]|nr:hypothetical protein [Bacillota bacterium]